MEKSILYTKSYDLTVSAYKQVAEILKESPDNQLAQWLFEDISSISVNLYIANSYTSKRSFLIKLYIAKRSSARALFWVELLRDLTLFSIEEANELSAQLTEILKMSTASIATVSKKKTEE